MTLNISDGKIEVFKNLIAVAKGDAVVTRIASTEPEQLDVLLSTQPPHGNMIHPLVRASLVAKTKDAGC